MSLRLHWPAVALVQLFLVIFSSSPASAQKATPSKSGVAAGNSATQKPAVTPPPSDVSAPAMPVASQTEQHRFASLDLIVDEAIRNGSVPGAVLIVGHNGQVVYRKAYGNRATAPHPELMTADTVFDIASLTKVLATTMCVMHMEQFGQIKLNDPVAKYIPDFAQNGKQDVTIRQLLTHYSG